MKTLIGIVGLILLLALVAVGQTGPQTSTTPAWSKPWSAQPAPSGVVPSDNRATPSAGQPKTLPPTFSLPTGTPAGHPEGNNPMAVTTTAGPVNLGPGDLIDITVFDSPDLATRVRISSNGEITFPLLGKLRRRWHDAAVTPKSHPGSACIRRFGQESSGCGVR